MSSVTITSIHKGPQTIICVWQEIFCPRIYVHTTIRQIAIYISTLLIKLNIVIVAVPDNISGVHRIECIGQACRLGLCMLCVYNSHSSEQQGCAEQGGNMSEKLFHLHCCISNLLLQYDVKREAVVVLAACGAKLHVDDDRGYVCAGGEVVVQFAGNALGDGVVSEWCHKYLT